MFMLLLIIPIVDFGKELHGWSKALKAAPLRHRKHHADAFQLHSSSSDCASYFPRPVMCRSFHVENRSSAKVSFDVRRWKLRGLDLRHLCCDERNRWRDEGDEYRSRYVRLDVGLVDIGVGKFVQLVRGAGRPPTKCPNDVE